MYLHNLGCKLCLLCVMIFSWSYFYFIFQMMTKPMVFIYKLNQWKKPKRLISQCNIWNNCSSFPIVSGPLNVVVLLLSKVQLKEPSFFTACFRQIPYDLFAPLPLAHISATFLDKSCFVRAEIFSVMTFPFTKKTDALQCHIPQWRWTMCLVAVKINDSEIIGGALLFHLYSNK